MGPDGNPAFDALHPDVAYNPTPGEYFVVWAGTDDGGALVAGETEIYGQRVDPVLAQPVGARIRISAMGPDGDPSFAALRPSVVYNPAQGAYFVAWQGRTGTGAFEVYGRTIQASDLTLGPTRQLTQMSASAGPVVHALAPSLAVDAESGAYYLAWHSNAGGRAGVYGRLLDASGQPTAGEPAVLSATGPDDVPRGHAMQAAAAYDPSTGSFWIAWSSDAVGGAPGEREIVLRRVGADGTPDGTAGARISRAGADGDATVGAVRPSLVADAASGEVFVVWSANAPDGGGAFEVYGQRIEAPTGAEVGPDDVRLSTMGADGEGTFSGFAPAVASSPGRAYQVVWRGDDTVDDAFDLYGQAVYADRALGDEGPDDDVRLTSLSGGVARRGAVTNAIAAGPPGTYLIVWSGDTAGGDLVAGEHEIFGRIVTSPSPPTVYADPTVPGPGIGTQADPFGALQDAIDAVAPGGTVIVAQGGTFAAGARIPSGKPLTVELPAGERVTIAGDVVTASALTLASSGGSGAPGGGGAPGPLAVYGEFGATGSGGSIAGTPTLRTGPVLTGTAGPGGDAGWRNLAFATSAATAADVFAVAPDRPTFTPRLYRFDALATGQGGSQGAFVPVTDPATPLGFGAGLGGPSGGGHAFWLYVFDDGSFETVEPASPLALLAEAPYDAAAAPGATFGAQDVDVTLSGRAIDCQAEATSGAAGTYFYVGNPYTQSVALAGLSLSADGFSAGAQVWDGAVGTYRLLSALTPARSAIPAGQAVYLECRAGAPDFPAAFDGTLTFDAAAGLTTGAPLFGKRAPGSAATQAATQAASLQASSLGFELEVASAGGRALADRAATVAFAPVGRLGTPDGYDLAKLVPLADAAGRSVALAVVAPDASGTPVRRALEALPAALTQPVEVGLDVQAVAVASGTAATLRAATWTGLPADWTVELIDTATGQAVTLSGAGASYGFTMRPEDTRPAASNVQATGTGSGTGGGKDGARVALGPPPSPVPLDAQRADKAAATSPRFVLRAGPTGTIPVELTSLAAQADGQAVTLTWQTLTETTNAGFAVEARRARRHLRARWPSWRAPGRRRSRRPTATRWRTSPTDATPTGCGR